MTMSILDDVEHLQFIVECHECKPIPVLFSYADGAKTAAENQAHAWRLDHVHTYTKAQLAAEDNFNDRCHGDVP